MVDRSGSWRVLVEAHPRPGAVNMAVDEALLEEADRTGRPALRLYRWSPACLSFGRNEPAARRYDRASLERLGVDVVRRPTGGRAVWHDDEVTYAVAAPVDLFGSLSASYHAIHERIAEALRLLGADAEIAPAPARHAGPRPDTAGGCFSAAVGGEVLVAGRKVVGSAQVRRGRALLQHGSILLGGSQRVIGEVAQVPAPAPDATTLGAALERAIGFDEVAEAVVQAWTSLGIAFAVERLSSPPPQRLTASFLDPGWTWRR